MRVEADRAHGEAAIRASHLYIENMRLESIVMEYRDGKLPFKRSGYNKSEQTPEETVRTPPHKRKYEWWSEDSE